MTTQGAFARVVFVAFLLHCSWLSEAIVGDQVPPPYPVIEVHVPEPMIGSMAKKWASEDNQERALHLGEIEQRLATSSQLLRVALAPLASKIEEVAAVAEAAVHTASGTRRLA
jgi:hypothetical protein